VGENALGPHGVLTRVTVVSTASWVSGFTTCGPKGKERARMKLISYIAHKNYQD